MKTAHKLKILISTILLTHASTGMSELEDNEAYRNAFQAWAASHVALLPTSFLPGPIGTAADLASIPIDVRIKTLPAYFIAPTPNAVAPNSPDGCHYDFSLPQKTSTYENLFGLADITPLSQNWGAFSNQQPPVVEHANAQVEVRVAHEYLNEWTESDKIVVFPSGDHRIQWGAYTQIDPLIDVTLPIAIFIASNEIKYLDSFFSLQTDPRTAARAAEIGGLFLINAGIELGLLAAGQVDSNLPFDSAAHTQNRSFTVYDINPPEISTTDANPDPLEANSFGGELWSVHKDVFRQTIDASDPCSQMILVGNDAPFKLPLGTTEVTWQVFDTGPLGGGNPGVATVSQFITVEDTRAPIILAPPSRVIESNTAASTDDFDVGNAVVFDVADPNPVISNTIGSGFETDTRTEVVWTATDSSGNSASKSQWITVKTPGTNTAPSVENIAASGLTSEPIDLTLNGSDNDFLSGRFDPLKFTIINEPENGFFVAPLVPYFIEDYRVRPGSTVGDILNNSPNPAAELDVAFCDNNQDIPVNFVYQSEFVHVDDSGTSYVLDRYWRCGNGLPTTSPRLSKWAEDGSLSHQIDINSSVKRITMDADGFLYAVTPGTNSDALFLNKLDADLNGIDSWKLDSIPASLGNPRLLGATYDSDTGLIFATDKRRVYIFDGADGQFVPAFLGTLKNAENFLSGEPSVAGSSSRGFYIEIDSVGNLYIVDSGANRIHKFNPTSYDGVTINIGEHIGWLGRCESGPGCDDENQRSIGYSCSANTPCDDLIADGNNCGGQIAGACTNGNGHGQFDTPIGMTLDPSDILYVTDYENSRVQRFTPLGDFAGEAASSCDGSCFVLGDMGRPLDISVNSSQFYVLDNDRELMHVFETAPFKEITENSVVVTYASNNDFQGVDTFSFIANDGLIDSNQGSATLNISRNFRPPEAIDSAWTLDEDTALNLALSATDPDGILGIDFNGLDTLNYSIIDPPIYGSLTGSGLNRVYTPDENYSGTDTFTFKVDDGVFDSETAVVTITVNEVNDVPEVSFTDENSRILPTKLWPLLAGKVAGNDIQAGLGYPLPLIAEYVDPDANQNHFLQINWGDGNTDSGSTTTTVTDPENPPEGPLMTNTFNAVGQIFTDHTYLTPGNKTISLQVFDDNAADSAVATAEINVIPMVDLTLTEETVDPEDYPEPGATTSVTIELRNVAPAEPVVGLSATNVMFSGELPEDVTLLGITTSQGSCLSKDQISTCQIGNLASDELVEIVVTMQPDPRFNPFDAGYVINASSNEPDASKNNLKVIQIPIKFDDEIFINGFD
ncbi:Ig-like domain-containing protein [Marinicella sp. S1101]|uniref:Ig-like domain-containing protein n=1 Tax=Marinicella marina TaxID=2996016 RepID=UPI002260B9A1|nr:Ig-like domain-containing protein [Marinicella marina]MCX7555079.1 Ig-like domain-containing protein [Marinicella marina]MDJ1141387.1 Ig-like domain-containing protein [Marinicella marina]